MFKHEPRSAGHLYAETKLGIVTRYGDWFHITSDYIDEYAPGLLDQVDLDDMIISAQAWVKSSDSLSMILLLVLLFFLNPWLAACIALLFHVVWHFNKSAVVTLSLSKLLKILNSDGFLLLSSLVVLSIFGIQESYMAVMIGLLLFFVFKPGFLRRTWNNLSYRISGPLTLNDRVFKMVIIQNSLKEDVPPSEIKKMENRMIELTSTHKK